MLRHSNDHEMDVPKIVCLMNQPDPSLPQHMHALQAYDAQVSSLARGMARLEEDLKGAQEEKAALLSDLASVRELCVKLDSGKELTACHLTSKSMELERVGRTAGRPRQGRR